MERHWVWNCPRLELRDLAALAVGHIGNTTATGPLRGEGLGVHPSPGGFPGHHRLGGSGGRMAHPG